MWMMPGSTISTGRQRVVFQITKAAGKGGMLLVVEILVAQEQHLVLEQRLLDLAKQVVVVDRFSDLDALQFGAYGTGELFNFHGHPLM